MWLRQEGQGEARKAENIFPPTLDTGFTRRMREGEKKGKKRSSWELHTSSSARVNRHNLTHGMATVQTQHPYMDSTCVCVCV